MSPVKKKKEGKRKATTTPLSQSPAKKANTAEVTQLRRSPRRNTSTPIPQLLTSKEPVKKTKSRKKLDYDLTISSPETSLSPQPSPIRSRSRNKSQIRRRSVVFSSSESSPEPPPRRTSRPLTSSPNPVSSPRAARNRSPSSSPERSREMRSPQETNWAVFTLYHPNLLRDFDDQTVKGVGNIHSVVGTLIELVGKTKPLPTSVQLGASDSHPTIVLRTINYI
jgi:hypothetical protein